MGIKQFGLVGCLYVIQNYSELTTHLIIKSKIIDTRWASAVEKNWTIYLIVFWLLFLPKDWIMVFSVKLQGSVDVDDI